MYIIFLIWQSLFIVCIFQTKALLGADNVYLDAAPANPQVLAEVDMSTTSSLASNCRNTTDIFCRNIKQNQSELSHETKKLENILKR
jgi:hypothetical protein